jgi:hypothetical protein
MQNAKNNIALIVGLIKEIGNYIWKVTIINKIKITHLFNKLTYNQGISFGIFLFNSFSFNSSLFFILIF